MLALLIGLAFLVLCIGAVVDFRWTLALLLLNYPLEQGLQGSIPLFVTNQSFANYIIGIIAVISLLRGILQKKVNLAGYFNIIWGIIFAAYVYSFISIAWSPSAANALLLVSDGIPYTILYIIIAPIMLDDIEDWNHVVIVSIIFGFIVAIAIIFSPEFTIRSGRLGMDFGPKMRSSPLAIGELGGFLMIAAGLLVFRIQNAWLGLARIVIVITGVILSIYSGSRGQFLFAAILILLFFPVSRPIKNISQFFLLSLGSIGIALLILFVLSVLVSDTEIANRWINASENERAVGLRSANISDLMNGFISSPSLWLPGMGMNAFTSLTGSQEPYSHSIFLDVLVEMGLVSFCLMFVCILNILKQSLAILSSSADQPDLRSAAAILVTLCVYQILLMNKQGQLWASQHTLFYFLLLAKVFANQPTDIFSNKLNEASLEE